jgi:RNA-directed DNA polymerase
MKKISRNVFREILGVDSKVILSPNGIKPLENSWINEFKIGMKFFYDLNMQDSVKRAQSNFSELFMANIPLNQAAKAFRKNGSYLDFIEEHRINFHFLRLDIKDFFHSISDKSIRSSFYPYFESTPLVDGKQQLLVDAFTSLVTYDIPKNSLNNKFAGKNILPMGFVSSPTISNILFRKQDILIQQYCASKEVIYTRYADDMLFSSNKGNKFLHSISFQKEIAILVGVDGFKLNNRKRIAANHTISLNGYVVSASHSSGTKGYIKVSNKKTGLIEELLYEIKKNTSHKKIMMKLYGFKISSKFFKFVPPEKSYLDKYCKDQIFNKLVGYRAYLISLNKYAMGKGCMEEFKVNKYSTLIKLLDKQISKW